MTEKPKTVDEYVESLCKRTGLTPEQLMIEALSCYDLVVSTNEEMARIVANVGIQGPKAALNREDKLH